MPTIHISDTDGAVLADYMDATADPKATFVLGNTTGTVDAAARRSPASPRAVRPLANDGDLLKPDITAPGAGVLAAVAPPSNSGRRLRPLLRHVDVVAAHRRSRGVHGRRKPGLVADDGQVRDDDVRRAR